jgi:FkbM family methyltransferase
MTAVSVITPVFNGTAFVRRAVASLVAQTLGDWELLAVDDASPDDSLALLDALAAADPRVRVLRHATNRGVAAARNTALREARGELVAYLDQDDEFYPDHLARAWDLRGEGDVLIFRYDLVEERPGAPGFGGVTTHDPAARRQHMFTETITVPLGVVHRRSLLDRTGPFDENLGKYRGRDEDGEMWRRFTRSGARVVYVPHRSGLYHVRAESLARTRQVDPATRVVTAEIRTPAGRVALWLPAADAWLAGAIFEGNEYGGLAPSWLRDPPTILDVGANAGTFAVYARLAYHPRAVVHCFEPCPSTLDLLRVNVAGFPGVSVHPVALGRADGEAHLLLDPGHPAGHSLRPDLVPAPAGRVRVRVRHAGAVWDELGLDEVDVLKLDAEGAEPDVLEALGPRVARVRVVMAEYHTPDDRRQIESLLPGHVRFSDVAHTPRIGVVKYARADLPGAPRG